MTQPYPLTGTLPTPSTRKRLPLRLRSNGLLGTAKKRLCADWRTTRTLSPEANREGKLSSILDRYSPRRDPITSRNKHYLEIKRPAHPTLKAGSVFPQFCTIKNRPIVTYNLDRANRKRTIDSCA
jgi:hypothetical protein